MADLRSTPELDTFIRSPESPLVGATGTEWGKVATMYYGQILEITSSGVVQAGFGGDAMYYWKKEYFNGDVEVWVRVGAGIDLTEAYRLGFAQAPWTGDSAGVQLQGYQLRVIVGIGAPTWDITRWDQGVKNVIYTQSDAGLSWPGQSEYLMFRINDTEIQAWVGTSDAQTWTKKISVVDTTYRNLMHPVIGLSSDDGANPEYWGFGAGRTTPPWVPQIIRKPARPIRTTIPDPHPY